MLLFPLSYRWSLAARTLIRQEFQDKYPTRSIDWSKSAAIVQEKEPKLLGICLVESEGFLRYLMVRKQYRGNRIGSQLLETCLPHITHLTCIPDRISFYSRYNFTVEGLAPVQGMVSMIKKTNG